MIHCNRCHTETTDKNKVLLTDDSGVEEVYICDGCRKDVEEFFTVKWIEFEDIDNIIASTKDIKKIQQLEALKQDYLKEKK